MKQEAQQDQFMDEIDKLVDRYRSEYDLTYASLVGCLHIKITEMELEALGIKNEDD